MDSDLDIAFKKAFDKISDLKEGVAPDIMLKFYAFYKQANYGSKFSFNSGLNVRNAFKFNAWMQLNGMSAKQAKKEYIKLAETILKLNK
jgi:diazepam-binding inhibitor (GABA receptor modulating acyl-CoA-binding protein)